MAHVCLLASIELLRKNVAERRQPEHQSFRDEFFFFGYSAIWRLIVGFSVLPFASSTRKSFQLSQSKVKCGKRSLASWWLPHLICRSLSNQREKKKINSITRSANRQIMAPISCMDSILMAAMRVRNSCHFLRQFLCFRPWILACNSWPRAQVRCHIRWHIRDIRSIRCYWFQFHFVVGIVATCKHFMQMRLHQKSSSIRINYKTRKTFFSISTKLIDKHSRTFVTLSYLIWWVIFRFVCSCRFDILVSEILFIPVLFSNCSIERLRSTWTNCHPFVPCSKWVFLLLLLIFYRCFCGNQIQKKMCVVQDWM